jgi:hypothetical protein
MHDARMRLDVPTARAVISSIVAVAKECGKPLRCGGECRLEPGHAQPCECHGDEEGRPGTCPA